MSTRFSILTKVLTCVLVLVISLACMQEAEAYHCKALEDKFWDEFWDLAEKAAFMAAACSPPLMTTGVGVFLCGVASVAFFRQSGKVRDANMAWFSCKAEHTPN